MAMDSPLPCLALCDGLVVSQAALLRETIMQALGQGVRVLDLSAVSECDTAGVQLLVSACKTAELEGGEPLALRSASPAVKDIMGRYGLAALLEGCA